MKRFYSILLGLGIMALVGASFTGCDSKDDSIDDPNLPGNAYFKVNMLDTTFVKTENIEAYLKSDGTFELKVEGLPDSGLLGFELMRFQEGTFPTNVNPMYYFPSGSDEFFISQDMNDPKRNNGFIKITKIDKQNKLISGNFNTRLLASPLNSLMNFPLKVDGEFKNIQYTRVAKDASGTFFYAYIDGTEVKDFEGKSNSAGDISNGQIVIQAESKYMRKRYLTFSFPKDAGVGRYEYNNLDVTYSSTEGIIYKSDVEDASLHGSYLEITAIDNTPVANVKMFSGVFYYKVKNKDGKIIEIQEGDFKTPVTMKEPSKPTLPGGGGGPIPI